MRSFLPLICLTFGLVLSFNGLLPAQMNLFNVPSGEIIEGGDIFYQQNLIVSKNLKLNTTLNYGLGKGWEAGINLLDLNINTRPGKQIIPFDSDQPSQNPDFCINFQKSFELLPVLHLSAGIRTGIHSLQGNKELGVVNYNYINSQFTIPGSTFRFVFGGYYMNPSYGANDHAFGLQTGIDVPVIREKLSVTSDFISGKNDWGTFTGGISVLLGQDWKFSIGGQLPNPGSRNNPGINLQINKK